jgi:hypothetical protein
MAALRHCVYLNHAGGLGPIPPFAPSLGISVAFCVVALAAAARTANRTAS